MIVIQSGREGGSRQMAWICRSTSIIVTTELAKSTVTPIQVRRTALRANSSIR